MCNRRYSVRYRRYSEGNRTRLLLLAIQIGKESVAEALAGIVEPQLFVDSRNLFNVAGVQFEIALQILLDSALGL